MHYSSICNVALVSVLLLGCSSTIRNYDIEQARSSRQSVLRQSEESKIFEDALQGQPEAYVALLRKFIQLQQEKLRFVKDYASRLDFFYGTRDRALMKLGEPTKQFEGDKIKVLQYEWSGCVCSAILSYDKTSSELSNFEFSPCKIHGLERFSLPSMELMSKIDTESVKINEVLEKHSQNNEEFIKGLRNKGLAEDVDRLLAESMLICAEILKITDGICANQGGKSED